MQTHTPLRHLVPLIREPEASPQPPAAAEGKLLGQLAVMAAFLKELELQSHLIHLNYTGSNFLPVHEFLKGQYEQHLEEFDTVAEFIRAMGAFLPGSNGEFRQAARGFRDGSNGEPAEQLRVYVANLEQLKLMAQQLEPLAQRERALDVVDFMAVLVGSCSKAAWFLKATLG